MLYFNSFDSGRSDTFGAEDTTHSLCTVTNSNILREYQRLYGVFERDPSDKINTS